MVTDPATRSARRDMGRILTDSCTIRRHSDQTFDPVTGTYTPTLTVVYSGPCRVQSTGVGDQVVVAGGQAVSLRTMKITVPWNVSDVALEDRVVIDQSPDPALVGAELVVRDTFAGTFAGWRTLTVEDIRT